MLTRALSFAVVALSLSAPSHAQCAQYTPIFHGGGFDAQPYAMTRFDDGMGEKLYAGGAFITAGAVHAEHVAVWDGVSWRAVGGGVGGNVWALAVHDDGNGDALYAGGAFLPTPSAPAHRVARWNGASWSGLGLGTNARVNALASFDDGAGRALFAAGAFTLAGTLAANHVAKWNGAAWSQLAGGLNGEVYSLAAHDDGNGPKLYACGEFAGSVARWDGASWQTIGAPLGNASEMRSLSSYAAGPGARWLIAGGRYMLGNYTRVARWDGASWQSLISGGASRISDLEVRQESGELVVYAGGTQGLERWSPSAGSSSLLQMPNTVSALASHDDQSGHGDELYAGGPFQRFDCLSSVPVDVQCVARFDGVSWRSVQPASPHSFLPPCCVGCPLNFEDAELHALARWRDPVDGRFKIVVGGWGTLTLDDPSASGLAVWDGVAWSRFPGSYSALVDVLFTWTDPTTMREVLIANGLRPTGAIGSTDVAQYDGVSWTLVGSNGPPWVSAFGAYQEPGAPFESLFAGSVSDGEVMRWDGVAWTSIGTPTGLSCTALLAFDPPGALGEELYAAFAQCWSTSPCSGVLFRWNGSQWSAAGPPSLNGALALAEFDDGAGPCLFLGSADRLWRFDGATWTSYPTSELFAARTLEVFDDGSGPALYMQSGFRFRNGQIQSYAPGGPTAEHLDMLAFEDGNGGQKALWFAGEFHVAGGIPSRGIARWSNPCGALTTYCTAKTNSLGCTPAIGWTGEPSVSASATTPFVITASNVLNQKAGLLYYGAAGRSAVPFQGGFKCVRFPALRTPPRSSGGNVGVADCSGVFAIDFTPWITGAVSETVALGVTVDAQWWSRDPASASTTGLTNAIEFEVRP